ncbi:MULTISPECIES: glycosyl hydrolase [Acidobacteriaceae]|uniref:glycosyl hydrolase n=1 Tax=Acidobacteriaceae TaxID=204434 RepID=UPI00131B6A2A|nr:MULTISPECIES: glycosyl hydrolase [Acidobacteriaceae]MDW5264800.1 glycosyl hydrolase [Edaphobacter sp.]
MKKKFAAALAGFVTMSALAQQPWQKIQMPTAASVQQAWMIPPSEYGPEPYYGLNGAVSQQVIERDLDTMKSLGYRAVTVQAGFGMPFAYLSPEYFQFFRMFVEEAKKRDMRVWIVDDAGYPSGFAGGKFTQLKPELRMQALEVAQRIPAKAGDTIKTAVGPDTVAVTAVNAADGKTITISVTNGAIAWTAPAGDWTVMVMEHQFKTSPTRSDTNPTHKKDGSQSLEDYMNPAATEQYLEFTHEQYKKAVGDEFGKTILGFRGDEPDYSISGLPWTPKFFERFQQVKGYDIRPYVATFLLPKGVEMTETQRRAKADYYDVFSQMFRDGFFKPQGEWCAANHLEYQVHLNHEEMEMELTHSEGDFLRDMKYVEVPGIDTIWHQIWTNTVSDFPRLASSAAHVYGHPRAFTESFAAYRPAPDVTMARYILNEQFVRGVNLIETMYFPATTGTRGGPAAYMKDPTYPALLNYVRRMSYLLSMGEPAASVALLIPSSSMWLGDAASDATFVSTERLLSEHQIDFDIVNEDALATDLKAGHGTLETMSGNQYRTVIVPGAAVLSQAVLDRLHTFATGGGKVLFLGRTPSLIAGQTILDARAATAADFAWATVETSVQLPETPTPPAYPPTTPRASQVVAPAILDAVKEAVIDPDVWLSAPDTSLRCMTRRLKDSSVYLFFNESSAPISDTVNFRNEGENSRQLVEAWDSATGAVSSVVSTRAQGTMSVQLQLKPYETRVLMVR